MNIVIFGAGAIGSLFGGMLAKNNDVTLVGRKKHVEIINKKGLKIYGKTNISIKPKAVTNVKDINFFPDLLIISVKSFDTELAIRNVRSIINKNTIVLSIQNGLDNIEKIKKYVKKEQIYVCITTHGSVFLKQGYIKHTGFGKTIIGAVASNKDNHIQKLLKIFNNAGIKAKISTDILKDIWIKAIINSSINPLTAIFKCKNGYLLKNPILEEIVDRICKESTDIANSCGFNLSYQKMIDETKKVIKDTSDNYSSMLQSLEQSKKTEINEINGKIVEISKKNNVKSILNSTILNLFNSL